jgi:hypothetical protein
MEQRREPRFQADQPVMVTILSDPEVRMNALVKNASGRGLGLIVKTPVRPGAAIRIEIDDSMVLGEAIYCRMESEGHFVGVELDQVLVGLTELRRILEGFSPELPLEARPPVKMRA